MLSDGKINSLQVYPHLKLFQFKRRLLLTNLGLLAESRFYRESSLLALVFFYALIMLHISWKSATSSCLNNDNIMLLGTFSDRLE